MLTATKSPHARLIKIKLMGPDSSKFACYAAVISGAGRSACSVVKWREDYFPLARAENEGPTDELRRKMRRLRSAF